MRRLEAIDAYLSAAPVEGLRRLAEVVRMFPSDHTAVVFRNAARATASATASAAASSAEAMARSAPIVPLAPLPFRPVLGSMPSQAPLVTLVRVSERRNEITDTDPWFTHNGLAAPVTRIGANLEDVPDHVAPSLRGSRLRRLLRAGDHDLADYGSVLVAFAPGKMPRAFDLRSVLNGGNRLELLFAQLAGNTLVVQAAYNGYAKESGGKNGYVAAFDVDSGHLLWASAALVANANNFVIAGGSVITGYGFTAEPDFLFVLDLATGATVQKLPVKSGPEWILAGPGDALYVRTYDTDYVFRPKPSLLRAPVAALLGATTSGPPATPTSVNTTLRCWAHVAADALDRREEGPFRQALRGLSDAGADTALMRALEPAMGDRQ